MGQFSTKNARRPKPTSLEGFEAPRFGARCPVSLTGLYGREKMELRGGFK